MKTEQGGEFPSRPRMAFKWLIGEFGNGSGHPLVLACNLTTSQGTATIPGTGRLLGGSAFLNRSLVCGPKRQARPTGESANELSIFGNRRKGITKFRANRWPGKVKLNDPRQMGNSVSPAHVR